MTPLAILFSGRPEGSLSLHPPVIDHFVLVLHFSVIPENALAMGSGGCGADSTPARKPEVGWPQPAVYGLLVPNPAERGFILEADGANATASDPKAEIEVEGSTSVKSCDTRTPRLATPYMRHRVREFRWKTLGHTG